MNYSLVGRQEERAILQQALELSLKQKWLLCMAGEG